MTVDYSDEDDMIIVQCLVALSCGEPLHQPLKPVPPTPKKMMRSRQITQQGISEARKAREAHQEIDKERVCRAKIRLLLELLGYNPESQPAVNVIKKASHKKKTSSSGSISKSEKSMKKKGFRGPQQEGKYVISSVDPLKLIITKAPTSETDNKDNDGNKRKLDDAGLEREKNFISAKKTKLMLDSNLEPAGTASTHVDVAHSLVTSTQVDAAQSLALASSYAPGKVSFEQMFDLEPARTTSTQTDAAQSQALTSASGPEGDPFEQLFDLNFPPPTDEF